MRSVPLPDIDDIRSFDQITAVKQGQRHIQMLGVRPCVLDAYEQYGDIAPDLAGLEKITLTAEQKSAMLHAYHNATIPMKKLREEILNRVSVARCPFCGISETSTLDHYLPKEKYPEFSVFSPNLVPSCSPCNTTKRDKIIDDNTDNRLFIHPYFDQVPQECFLCVSVELQQDALFLSFYVNRPSRMSLDVFDHLRSHFSLLKLADRYRKMGLEYMGGLYPSMRRAYGPDEDAERVVRELMLITDDFELRYGENYWLAALCRALAVHDEFCDGGFEILGRVS